MSGPPFDLSETDRLLSTTRAVRRRLDLTRPVEREVLLECVALAQQAPTASNTQGWRWLFVTDAAKRQRIGEIYAELAAGALPFGRRQVAPGDDQTERVYDSAEWLAEHLAEVPVHAIPCITGRVEAGSGSGGLSAIYGSIFPAVWSFQLALRSRGLGSALTTIHLFREAEFAELLGIPDDMTQVALLPVAYTVGTDFKVASRPSAESICHWDRWDDPA